MERHTTFRFSKRYKPVIIPPEHCGLPVMIVGVGLGLGTRWVAWTLNRLPQVERRARHLTGVIFIVAGIYLSLVYIFGIL